MGRISIPKFAAALAAGLAAFGVTGFAVAQGGLTANIALSGTFFKVNMSHLEGEGLSIFVDRDQMGEETIPAARLKFEHAVASNLCLSANLPDVPGVGETTFALRANGDDSVEVRNLLVGATDIKGELDLTNANVGVDASQVNDKADPGSWGLYAQKVTLSADDIRTTSVGAEKLAASGVTVAVKRGSNNNAC